MSALISHVFKDTKVRAIDSDGEIWFVANDVCKALEIRNTSDALKRLDDDEKTTLANSDSRAGQGAQSYSIINESGLYSLVLRSRKAEAKRFKKWVTSEVLPSIRKTGSYRQTLDARQQYEVKEAVSRNVAQTGRTYQAVYHDLYSRFSVPKYQDILSKDFQAALAFLNGHSVPRTKPSMWSEIDEDGRWLVVVENRCITTVKNLKGHSIVDADGYDKLMQQTIKQAGCLVELARRMRYTTGDCSKDRLDKPIEELAPVFIV